MRGHWAWFWTVLLLGAWGGPARAEWHEAKTRHFIIYADQTAEGLSRYAQRLERFDQGVRALRGMKDPPLAESSRLTVFVVNSLSGIERLAGGYDVYGFYIPRASGSVAFVPKKAGSKSKWDIDAEAVFFHEYAHHLQLQFADVAVPVWVSEGFAEFFAATEIRDDGSIVVGVPPAYRAPALFELSALSIQEMLGADSRFEDTEFIETYGRGWLLTHFLTFDRQRRGQLDAYIAAIQRGTPPLAAAKAAFGDLDQLHRQLGQYLRQKKLPHLILSPKNVLPGISQIRALRLGEAAMINVLMRSRSGTSKRIARDVAASARKIAIPYPNDAFVQAALAEAELGAENYALAEAASDRALAADPQNYRALVYKGRARMELARPSQNRADWPEIRTWFLKANKVDPEAAEPLLHFYNAYLYAGARPTKNAVDGLLYALAIAPRDDKLRVVVVRQLLADGNIRQARRYFAPFAFQPHAQASLRAASDKVMKALNAGDRNAALTHLASTEKVLNKEN